MARAHLTETMARRVETVVRGLSRAALNRYLSVDNIRQGFEMTGLWPFNPDIIIGNIRGIRRRDNAATAKKIQQAVPKVLELAR